MNIKGKYISNNRVTQLLHKEETETKRKLNEKLNFDHNSVVNNFEWIIRHLMLPHHKLITRGLDVFIPEIVLFKDGEASEIFCNKELEDSTIKKINK